jgi:hypothetical protein
MHRRVGGPLSHPSFDATIAIGKRPESATASANFSKSGVSRCSSMFGISSETPQDYQHARANQMALSRLACSIGRLCADTVVRRTRCTNGSRRYGSATMSSWSPVTRGWLGQLGRSVERRSLQHRTRLYSKSRRMPQPNALLDDIVLVGDLPVHGAASSMCRSAGPWAARVGPFLSVQSGRSPIDNRPNWFYPMLSRRPGRHPTIPSAATASSSAGQSFSARNLTISPSNRASFSRVCAG